MYLHRINTASVNYMLCTRSHGRLLNLSDLMDSMKFTKERVVEVAIGLVIHATPHYPKTVSKFKKKRPLDDVLPVAQSHGEYYY